MTTSCTPRLRLLAEADLLLAYGQLFAQPDAAWSAICRDLRRAVAGPEFAGLVDRDLLSACGADAERVGPAVQRELHAALFEGAQLCPANETVYVRRDKGAILGDVAGFYAAFGFELAPALGEKPDHLICELEFLAMLLVLQAEAPGPAQAALARDAARAFAADHLAPFLPAFAAALQSTDRAVYAPLGGALASTWQALALRLGLDASTAPDGGGRDPVDPDAGCACGRPDA